jgi:hypothetical protein
MNIHFLICISDAGQFVFNRQRILMKMHTVDLEDLEILKNSNRVGEEAQ